MAVLCTSLMRSVGLRFPAVAPLRLVLAPKKEGKFFLVFFLVFFTAKNY